MEPLEGAVLGISVVYATVGFLVIPFMHKRKIKEIIRERSR